jgi:hypothetical protein
VLSETNDGTRVPGNRALLNSPERVIPASGDRLVVGLWTCLVERGSPARETRMFRVYAWSAVLPEEGRRGSTPAGKNRERLAALGRERLRERVDHGIVEAVRRCSWDPAASLRARGPAGGTRAAATDPGVPTLCLSPITQPAWGQRVLVVPAPFVPIRRAFRK